MINVDLNIRVLPRNHEVFYARPGYRYRFYLDFVQNDAIFLDLPDFSTANDSQLILEQDLIPRIHRARALKNWLASGSEGTPPSTNLVDYRDRGEGTGVAQYKAAILGYFTKAKKGDLVVITPQSFSNLAYIGEFSSDPPGIEPIKVNRVYGNALLPGRRVDWVGKIEKRFLSREILDISQKPNIFVSLPRSSRHDLYNLVYGGYTLEDEYTVRFDVTEDEFTSLDDLRIQSFFNFVAVNTRAFSKEGDGKYISLKDSVFIDAGEFTPDLKTDVSSPGFLSIFSPKLTPLVAAALFVIAVDVGPSALQAANEDRIRIGNSQAPADDPCVADVHRQVINQIKLSGEIGWPEACRKAQQAAEKNGLKGPSKLKK